MFSFFSVPKTKTKIWFAIGAVALIAIVYFAFLRKPKIEYNTLEAGKTDLSETVSVTGTLKANDTISLNFEATGRISEVKARVGQTVAKGDVLAMLEDSELQLGVDRTRADLDRARAEAGQNNDYIHSDRVRIENAEKTLDETKDLNDANVAAADQSAEDAENKLDDAQEYYDQVKDEEGAGSAAAKLAKLTLDTAEAGYNDAKKNQDIVDQQGDLQETEAENNLESAKADLAQDKSRYVAAANDAKVQGYEVAYETALNNLDKTVLRAPAAGIIKEMNFKVGEVFGGTVSNINSSSDFAKMISFDDILEAKVPESDIAKIALDQSAAVMFDAFSSDEKFEAKVVSIEPSATVVQDVVDYVVKLAMDMNDARFKDGMSSDVDISIENKSGVIAIPQRAVQEKNGKRIVQVLENGKPVDHEVKMGLEGDGGMVEIVSGLSEGDMVITSTK